MEVFLTGATGYIGRVVAEKLVEAGHTVTGLARSEESAKKLEGRAIRVHRGDVKRPETVAEAARKADAVIHTALPGTPDAGQTDRALVTAVVEALSGSRKPFLYTSGVWVVGNTGDRVADEETPLNPAALVAWRPAVEQIALGAGAVIRPAMVYGRSGGVPMSFVKSARERGAARVVGDGGNRWTFVDVDDLADLYILALGAPAGTVLFGADAVLHVREVAAAASKAAGAGGKVEYWPLEEARKLLGPFADALALDQQVSGERARRLLGWRPKSPPVFESF